MYCYEGNSEAIGEYYDFRRVGDEILGRFRWFEDDIRGFVWFKIDSVTRLSGAWWMEDVVPASAHNDPEALKKTRGMNSYVWTKQANGGFPAWAKAVLGGAP